MGFVAGPYRWFVTYMNDSQSPTPVTVALGVTTDAVRLRRTNYGEEIVADVMGGQPIDWISQGFTETLDMVFAEWNNSGVQAILASQGTQRATFSSDMRYMGCPMVYSRGFIIFAEAFGSCASPVGFIARNACIPPNFNLDLLMGSRAKQVPLQLQLYPYAYDTTNISSALIYCHEEWVSLPIAHRNDFTNHMNLVTYLANLPSHS